MVPYVVRAGDHVPKLALSLGVSAQKIWLDPSNADLRKRRKDMHMLCTGDVIYLPAPPPRKWLAVAVGTSNKFVASVPTVPISVTFAMKGKPLANESCLVHELPPPDNKLTTDGSGKLSFDAHVRLEFINVSFPRLGLYQRLRVGHLDPADTDSGVLQRLRNMGYVPASSPSAETGPEMMHSALLEFQRAQGLPITGELDSATRDKLSEIHGS